MEIFFGLIVLAVIAIVVLRLATPQHRDVPPADGASKPITSENEKPK